MVLSTVVFATTTIVADDDGGGLKTVDFYSSTELILSVLLTDHLSK